MDRLTPEQRHKNMVAVKAKGTKPELLLAKAMWNAGLRYRKNDKTVYGHPDFVHKGKKIAISVDGEMWHGKDDLAVFVYSNHFSDDLEHLRKSKGIAIGLKDSASALSLASGFMQTKYLVLHNKSDLSVVYNIKGSPRLLTAKDVSDYHVVLKDSDIYIVFDVDMARNNLDIQIDTRKLIADSEHKGYDSVIRPIAQYMV